MEKCEVNRTVLNVAGVCNLKCKNCLAFIPYYEKKWIMGLAEAKITIKNYFDVVDSVGTFTITGGEPLLNQEIAKILWETNIYRAQIRNNIDFVTNATIVPAEDVLNFFAQNRDHARIILSDYGPELSVKMDEIRALLDERNITYRVSKFVGDDMYFDGWIDFSDHSLKWDTIESRDANARKCIHGAGKYFVINDGEIHRCSRSYWRIKNGIIPKVEGEYCPINDSTLSIEEKRNILNGMMKQTSVTSCGYCVGLVNGVKRVKPAIQL